MDKYELGNLVGQGSFGSVLLVRRRCDGAQLVMKRLPIHNVTEREMEAYHNEIRLLSELEHPGIVCYMESFVDRPSMLLCIVMRFCDGGDLANYIRLRAGTAAAGSGSGSGSGGKGAGVGSGRLSEREIKYNFVQMALALHFMHEKNILHRDLKAGNVFLRGGLLQLGDFGISKVLGGAADLASTCIGTPYYMSPELFKSKPYNHKSDVWALGCILYEMTELRHAFDASNLSGLATKVINGVYPPIAAGYSRDLRDLIGSMLGATPSSRPSVKQILLNPCLYKSIVKYVKLITSPQQDVASLVSPSEAEYRPAHVLNLRNQLERIGGTLGTIFAEVERERGERRASSSTKPPPPNLPPPPPGQQQGGRVREKEKEKERQEGGRRKRGSRPPGAAAAAAAAALVSDDHSALAVPPIPSSSAPSTTASAAPTARAPRGGGGGSGGGGASRPTRHNHLQTRLALLDREHASQLEELRMEEEARAKLAEEFERLQRKQEEKLRSIQARRAQLGMVAANGAEEDGSSAAAGGRSSREGYRDRDRDRDRDRAQGYNYNHHASLASTVTAGSNNSTVSSGANLPIIPAAQPSSLSPSFLPFGSAASATPAVAAPVAFPALPIHAALLAGAGAGAGAASSASSSRQISPAFGPSRVGRGGVVQQQQPQQHHSARMPAMVLGGGAIPPSNPAVAAVAATARRSASPSPSFSAVGGGGGVGGGHSSAAPSPRFNSRRLTAIHAQSQAQLQGGVMECKDPSTSSSPRMSGVSSAQDMYAGAVPLHGAQAAQQGEKVHLKLLKRKVGLRAHNSFQHADLSGGGPSEATPGGSDGPSPHSPALVTRAGRPRNHHQRVELPVPVHGSAASFVTSGLSPPPPSHHGGGSSSPGSGSALEAELALERVELARLKEEREKLEDALTQMDDVLFEGVSAVAGTHSPFQPHSRSSHLAVSVVDVDNSSPQPHSAPGGFGESGSSGSSSAPPLAVQRVSSHPPPLRSMSPAPTSTVTEALPSSSLSAASTTVLPSAFDAPHQYKGRQSRRHSAAPMLDSAAAAAALAAATAASSSSPLHQLIVPRHRASVGSSTPTMLAAPGLLAPVAAPAHSHISSVPAGGTGVSGGSTRDRILAQKAQAKSDQASAEAARLLQARKEYFNDRVRADQRTKDFYHGNAPVVQVQTARSASPSPEAPGKGAGSPYHRGLGLGVGVGSMMVPHLHAHSSASPTPRPVAVYDEDRPLHVHASLSPPGGSMQSNAAAAAAQKAQQLRALAYDEEELAATQAEVAAFQHQMAQYTRRIETLRMALTSTASATAALVRGGAQSHGSGASSGNSSARPRGNSGDAPDQDGEEEQEEDAEEGDEPHRSGGGGGESSSEGEEAEEGAFDDA